MLNPPHPVLTGRMQLSRLPATFPGRLTGGLQTGMSPSSDAWLPGGQHKPLEPSTLRQELTQVSAEAKEMPRVPGLMADPELSLLQPLPLLVMVTLEMEPKGVMSAMSAEKPEPEPPDTESFIDLEQFSS
eukprot:759638-Hanusia_phi.AAC.3